MGTWRLAANFENLTAVRASLEATADGLGRALAEGLATDARPLLATAQLLTPLGPGPELGADEDSDSALPHIRDTLAVTVQGGTIVVSAAHPGAKVLEYGGTIRPRGTPITFRPQAMVRRAAAQHLPEIERAVDERIARLL